MEQELILWESQHQLRENTLTGKFMKKTWMLNSIKHFWDIKAITWNSKDELQFCRIDVSRYAVDLSWRKPFYQLHKGLLQIFQGLRVHDRLHYFTNDLKKWGWPLVWGSGHGALGTGGCTWVSSHSFGKYPSHMMFKKELEQAFYLQWTILKPNVLTII